MEGPLASATVGAALVFAPLTVACVDQTGAPPKTMDAAVFEEYQIDVPVWPVQNTMSLPYASKAAAGAWVVFAAQPEPET